MGKKYQLEVQKCPQLLKCQFVKKVPYIVTKFDLPIALTFSKVNPLLSFDGVTTLIIY